MADQIYSLEEPDTEQADADTHGWGMEFTVSANVDCVGGRAWVPTSGRPPTFFWQLWQVDGAVLLAEVNLNSLSAPTPDDWMSFTSADFSTPGNVPLDSTEDYVVNVFFQGGDGVFTDDGSETFPVGNGVVSSTTGRFNNGQLQTSMPATSYLAYFFADLEADSASATGTLDITLPAATVTMDGEAVGTGTLSATLSSLVSSFSGESVGSGSLNITLPNIVVDAVGLIAAGGTLNITLPALTITMAGTSASGGNIMGPCGWTVPDPLCCDEWEDLDPAIQSAAKDYGATILWAATGRRFGLCEVTVRPCGMKKCNDGSVDFYGYDWSGGTWVPYIFNGTWFNCACPGVCCCDPRCQIRLAGPVESIVEVTLDGIAVDPDTYRVDEQYWLVRTGGECWPTCAEMNEDTGEGVLTVTYMRGDPIPATLLNAAATLACEWGKACTGSGTCRLGNRVTNLARNGVTIDMTSPEDLLNAGLTGIFEVDQIIHAWNPYKLHERGRIKAPELRTPRTVTSP